MLRLMGSNPCFSAMLVLRRTSSGALCLLSFFFFQAEDGIRDHCVTGVQTCALPICRRKDGSLIDISLSVSPLKDADGRIVGASKIARDITEHKRAQEQQNLLLREMGHRVKNLFAVASSVVSLSARSADTPENMAKAVRARLDALTRAQELTRPGLMGTPEKSSPDTTLQALVRTILSPYVDWSKE